MSVAALVLAATAAVFEDTTTVAKLQFKHENSPTSVKYLIETMGGGVALLDYDGDGRLDIFFTNGAQLQDPMPPGALPDKTDRKYFNRLFRNNPDGTFTDVTEKAGLAGPPHAYGMGVAAGDFDNDGRPDLYVTNYGPNILYRNRGDGTFEDVTARAGVAASGWSTSAGFFDFDNDGRLDLFVCRYLDWDFAKNRYCGEPRPGYRAYCHPDNFKGISNILFRNNGDGTFTDVSERSGVAAAEGKALGVAFADYDGDGFTDVYVANDSVQCFLFHNKRNGTFEEVGLAAGAGYNEDGRAFAGMGADFADYDNDGRPDIFVTNLSNETYALYRNTGNGAFTYVTGPAGVAAATLKFSGWGTKFIDYDNDGWKDIFAAQGHVLDTIELTEPNLRYLQPPLLLRNEAGRFRTIAAAAAGAGTRGWAGRGTAFGDLDNDGDIDIVVSNCGQPAYILSNVAGNRNNWLRVQLQGTKSNRDGIGSRIIARLASGLVQSYEVQTGGSYLSANDPRVLIGLGREAAVAELQVRWPSGATQTVRQVKSGRTLRLVEP